MKKFLTLTLLSLLVGVSAQASVTIYVQNADNSSVPGIYIWNSSSINTPWGSPAYLDGGTKMINGMTFHYKEFSEDSFSFLIYLGDNTTQTNDFAVNGEGDYFFWYHPTKDKQDERGGEMADLKSWSPYTLKAFWLSNYEWTESARIMHMYAYNGNDYVDGAWPGSTSNVSFVGKRDGYNVWKWEHEVNATSTFLSGLKLIFVGEDINGGDYDKYRSTTGMTCSTNGIWWTNWVEQDNPASYSRTFASTNGSTVCLPFALTASEAAEYGKFYALKSVDGSNVVFSSVEATEACVPYYFVPKADNVTISSEGKTIEFDLTKMDVKVGDVTFSGTLAATSKSGVYGFQGGDLVYAAQAVNIPEFRAYLSAEAGAKLSLSFEDETGINTISRGNTDNVYYDLQGRRVANPTKGLFIVNGKKVIK